MRTESSPASTLQQAAGDPRFQAPVLSLPKGGPSMQGMGEKFAVNSVSGSGSLTIPLPLSPGRGSIGPALTLRYDSGNGQSVFGQGWSLDLPAITRKTDKQLPRYRDLLNPGPGEDVFLLAGMEDLVPIPESAEKRTIDGREYQVVRYRPRLDAPGSRVERWTAIDIGEMHWRVWTGGRECSLFGLDRETRIADPADATRTYSWLLSERSDGFGNVVRYVYKAEDGAGVDFSHAAETHRSGKGVSAQRYLKRILYGNRRSALDSSEWEKMGWRFEAVLDYGEHGTSTEEEASWAVRPDPSSSYRPGFEIRTYRRCHRVLMFHHFPEEDAVGNNCLVRSLDLSYRDEHGQSMMVSAQVNHYRRESNGAYVHKALPGLAFDYSSAMLEPRWVEVTNDVVQNAPLGTRQWMDYYGEGLPGLLEETANAWFYQPNRGEGRWGAPQLVQRKPSNSIASARLMDLEGNGLLQLVEFEGQNPGYFRRARNDDDWQSFRSFPTLPVLDWKSPSLRFIDLDGDGRADVLITEDDAITWHESLGENGFGEGGRAPWKADEAEGPRLVFAESQQSVFIADMNGDGLADLVRIRHNEVCYWPNLGHGAFGSRVRMDNPPHLDDADGFEPARIRLADLDGSGPSDLLYLGADGAVFYRNLGGNAWSAREALPKAPRPSDFDSVEAIDLLGQGTTCLVWSSVAPGGTRHRVAFLDLYSGNKPRLLTGVRNAFGGVTKIQYASSTKFYLADQAAGHPWATKLPFPVPVVARTETLDSVSRNRFVTRYAYHHGYYDREEREFCGFGMVEQFDTEEYGVLSNSGELNSNIGATSHLPPTRTKSWFHTGAWIDQQGLSEHFAREYYQGPLIGDRTLGLGGPLTTEELRQAHRSLKGSLLRQEVYSDDNSPLSRHPYSATESTYQVRMVRGLGEGPHAVFSTHHRETVSVQYERRPHDPRVSQQLTLAVDDFGNVTESLSISFGRRAADPSLTAADQAPQTASHAVYERNAYTNAVNQRDAYRGPLACEASRFRVTGNWLISAQGPLTMLAVRAALANGSSLELLSRSRTLYRADDLATVLPLGVAESLGLPATARTLAFPAGAMESIYSGRVNRDMLFRTGYREDSDGNWWIESGSTYFAPDATVVPANELRFAREHFFLPHCFIDSFGAATLIEYEKDLFPFRQHDPLGNTVEAQYDYRLLAPTLLTDANGNRSRVSFDIFGMVAGTAVQGKLGELAGDHFDTFTADVSLEDIAAFFDAPLEHGARLLGSATSRVLYRFDTTPLASATIGRVTHAAELDPGQPTAVHIHVSYYDGLGRIAQTKLQAEPTDTGDARWVGSGWTITNNKGLPVRQYEPYFSGMHRFEFARTEGVSATTLYDSAARAVAVLAPDHTWTKVVFDSWHSESWDACDTSLIANPAEDTNVGSLFARLPEQHYLPSWHAQRASAEGGTREKQAAEASAMHAGTPARSYLDSLGRTYMTVAHNRFRRNDEIVEEFVRQRSTLDLLGNVLAVEDGLGRTVVRYRYSLLNQKIFEQSMEAGERWLLPDAHGKVAYLWDSLGNRVETRYDPLRRPIEARLLDAQGIETVVARTVYGESLAAEEAISRNLRTRVATAFDAGGAAETLRYDFKGNPVASRRRFWLNYRTLVSQDDPGPFETTEYLGSITYDALNRAVSAMASDGSIAFSHYNPAGLLDRLDVQLPGEAAVTAFVANIDYDAKGQRTRIVHGNGVETRYSYDPLTFRLEQLRTTRGSDVVQDLRYTYDAQANIVHVADNAQAAIYFRNAVVDTSADYRYDALYRLIEATGREHVGQLDDPETKWRDEFRLEREHPEDGLRMRRYAERFHYDMAGNLLRLFHQAAGAAWSREFVYAEPSLLEADELSNRLTRATSGQHVETFAYDRRGNMLGLGHLPSLTWDYSNQLRRVDLGGGGTAFYVYDSSGQRVRKVIEDQQGRKRKERFYTGVNEDYREYTPAGELSLRRESLTVLDVARVESRTAGTDGSPARLLRFQHSNHLGSVCLELDEAGALISHEEFHPYGTTSFEQVRRNLGASPKRYRFTGKERDEESGLHYHGARYYAPWLGRWTACDPSGLADGPNVYLYCQASPVCHFDPDGREPKNPTPQSSSRPGSVGHVAPYKDQINIRRMFGQIITEAEHMIPRGRLETLLFNPSSNSSDFKGKDYRRHPTVIWEREAALHKTRLDNAATRAGKGKPESLTSMIDDAYEWAIRAADATDSRASKQSIVEGILGQVGDLFEQESLQETGKRLAALVPDSETPHYTIEEIVDETQKVLTGEMDNPRALPPPSKSEIADLTKQALDDLPLTADDALREIAQEGPQLAVRNADNAAKFGAKKLFSIVPGLGFVAELVLKDEGTTWGEATIRGAGAEVGLGPIDATTAYDGITFAMNKTGAMDEVVSDGRAIENLTGSETLGAAAAGLSTMARSGGQGFLVSAGMSIITFFRN